MLLNKKEIAPPDPKQEALLFLGYLLRNEEPTAWVVLDRGEYQGARYTDVDGTVFYSVSPIEAEEVVFSAIYTDGQYEFEYYEPGQWESALSITYKIARVEEKDAAGTLQS